VPARQLARVVLDDVAAIGSLVTMNPEKQGLKFEPAFHDAIRPRQRRRRDHL